MEEGWVTLAKILGTCAICLFSGYRTNRRFWGCDGYSRGGPRLVSSGLHEVTVLRTHGGWFGVYVVPVSHSCLVMVCDNNETHEDSEMLNL